MGPRQPKPSRSRKSRRAHRRVREPGQAKRAIGLIDWAYLGSQSRCSPVHLSRDPQSSTQPHSTVTAAASSALSSQNVYSETEADTHRPAHTPHEPSARRHRYGPTVKPVSVTIRYAAYLTANKPAFQILCPTSKSLDGAAHGPTPASRPSCSHRRPQT